MATIAEALAKMQEERKAQQTQQTAPPVAEKPSWVKDLIDKRFQPDEKRKQYTPIGFNFEREPFDPSSYYRALGSFRDVSRNATKVVEQEVANREEAERQRAYEASQAASNKALGGVSANFTYDGSGKSRKYGLKGVSPHTGKMADFLGSKFGYSSIGGYRSHGSVPGSDHPRGTALDLMINRGKAQGNATANYLVKNAKALNVKYVIWNRMIWNPSVSNSWRRYSGPSPHTDHVHVSFKK